MKTDFEQAVIQSTLVIKIDTTELAKWTPERIAAFLDGVARVLAQTQAGRSGDA